MNKPYLEKFEYYCKNENALEELRESTQTYINFQNFLSYIEEQKKEKGIINEFEENVQVIEKQLEECNFYHYTSVKSILEILSQNNIYSLNNLQRQDILFYYRLTSQGLKDEAFSYIALTLSKKNWLFGLCRIKFKKGFEKNHQGFFYTKWGDKILYTQKKSQIFDISDWKKYLTNLIAIENSTIDNYINDVLVNEQIEIFIKENIPFTDIENITCKSKECYEYLKQKTSGTMSNSRFSHFFKLEE